MYDTYTYVLRYQLHAFNDNDKANNALLDFCRRADIDAVALMSNAEDVNTGHMTEEELEGWLVRAEALAKRIRAAGMAVSLNPWESLLHCDRGRRLRGTQRVWMTLTDQNGKAAEAQACPADPDFLDYLCNKYAEMARRIQPDVFWIDDDARLHNHAPLLWGGCFCPRHMDLFGKALGRPVSREEFVRGLLAVRPNEYREAWLSVMGKTMTEFYRRTREAVEAACPGVRMGQMCSDAISHNAEGRDFEGICEALTTKAGPPYIRITQCAYPEMTPMTYQEYYHYVTRFMRACAPARMKTLPELENFPFSAYSKSVRFTRTQIESAGGFQAVGMTLDLFGDNGVEYGDEMAEMLRQIKPFLVKMRALTENEELRGLTVLSDPRASAHVHTKEGKSLTELYTRDREAVKNFAAMGIATRFGFDPSVKGQVVTAFDQYFRGLSDGQIEDLLKNNHVILDAVSVSLLVKRNLGHLIGVKGITFMGQDDGIHSMELLPDGKVMTSQCWVGNFSRIDYDEARIRVLTEAIGPTGEAVCHAMVEADGHVLVIPYSDMGLMWYNYQREHLVKEWLRSRPEKPFMMAEPGAYLSVEQYGNKVVVTNFCGDDKVLRFDAVPATKATLYDAVHPQGLALALRTDGGVTETDYVLPHGETAVIEF